MIETMAGTEIQFDYSRAIGLCDRLDKIILEVPLPEEFGELAITVWGYRAALDEISRLREALIQREMLIECGSTMAGVPAFLESFRDKAKANLRAEGLIE